MPDNQEAPLLRLSDLARFIPNEFRDELPSTKKSLPVEADEGKVVSEAIFAEYAMRLVAAYCRALKDALRLYAPLPMAAEFHSCMAHIRLLNGSNQAGKSLAAGAEFARVMRGMDPYGKRANKDLAALVIGKDHRHNGTVIWKKLWFPGEFQIVPDEIDNSWRAVRPDPADPNHIDPIDLARKKLWQPAPPLIPPAAIKHIAWEDKASGVPGKLFLQNGSEAWFCTSNGDPPQGVQVDYAWPDEEIDGRKWIPEIWPRLVKREGIFVWSYTPQESTPEAYALYQRFLEGDPDVEEFKLLVSENPYLTDSAKAKLYASYAAQGAEQVRVRWDGEHAIASRVIYPEFLERFHHVPSFPVPATWMRVATVDPGTTAAAGLFGAVPPAADKLHVYDELVVRNNDADAFAKEFKRKCGPHVFEVYIIDKQAGQQRSMGRTNTVAEHYQEAFERAGVHASRVSGRGFIFGTPDVDARELSVKRMLNQRTVVLHEQTTLQLTKQIKNRLRDIRNPSKRDKRTEHDLCDDFEYMLAYFDGRGLYHNPPPSYVPQDLSRYGREVLRHFDKEKARERRRPAGPSRIASSR